MDVFQIEDLRIELLSDFTKEKSPIARLQLLNKFIKVIIDTEESKIIEAYLAEFIPKYNHILKDLNPFGLNPDILDSEVDLILKIVSLFKESALVQELNETITKVKNQSDLINEILHGRNQNLFDFNLSFPVNIQSSLENTNFGQLETFSIKIHKDSSLSEDKFIIIPSREMIDPRLENQIKSSWSLALNFLRKYYRNPATYHEVVLIFNHKYAELEGFSLGLAITLGFIQELFKFYNTSLILSINSNVTFTGGIDKEGKVKSLGKEIIESKTETVFYSNIEYFGLPEDDYLSAKNKLGQLKNIYPDRKLKLIQVDNFDDLINHRQIITLKKAKIRERSSKFIKMHSLPLILSLIIFMIIGAYFIYSLDDNPNGFEISSNTVHIVNKHGKILWSTKQPFNITLDKNIDEPYVHKLYDVNRDGTNEVILANERLDTIRNGRVACYSNSGSLLWEYLFEDTISTIRHTYDSNHFYSFLVGIVEEEDKTVLLCNARHLYFPSAIYKLDIETGKRLDGELWSQGHFFRGNVGDFDKDGKQEIFIGGINNAMESAFVLLVDYDKLNGQTPNLPNNLFLNLPIAELREYFLINKTDITRYLKKRFNGIINTHYEKHSGEYLVNTFEGKIKLPIGVVYRFNKDFSEVTTQIGDDLQFIRDSLVIKGELNPPLTNDPHYSEILLEGIKRWDGKGFKKFY